MSPTLPDEIADNILKKQRTFQYFKATAKTPFTQRR